MKISIEWLSQYVQISESAQEVADILSELGFPLEGIEDVDGDKVIGVTTSGGYGHAVGKSLAFAYVQPAFAAVGVEFDIEIRGDKRKAKVIDQPIYDPENARLRA